MDKITAGILAHVDTGKTTLSEALLYETKVISSPGRVDLKNAYLDNDEDEKKRGITIYTKNARIPLGNPSEKDGRELILIDTPGHVDFSSEMERCLSVLDIGILLVSASSKVQAHTKTLWSLLKSYNIPTFIFVNKMDMPDTDREEILENIRRELSTNAVDFSRDMDEDFYESVATASEELLDEYLESGRLSDSSIISAIEDRMIFPVYFGSALRHEGIENFVKGLERFTPRNLYGDKYYNEAKMSEDTRSSEAFSAIVYKIARDSKGVRLSFMKILSGKLIVKQMLGDEKINEIRLYNGEKYKSVQEVYAGDICALVSLNNTKTGDIYGNVRNKMRRAHLLPALSYAVRYPKDVDRNQLMKNLNELCEEDPLLNVSYNEETREIIIYLMGDVHGEILKNTIENRFGIKVDFTDGKVLYKETIDASFEGVGHFEPLRHYAEAHIMLAPNERGEGMSYEADIPEDLLARNWQRLIMTHMQEKQHKGVLIGAPITDIKLSLVSGKAHIKHTEGGDFRQATYRAIRQGLMELKARGCCHLLEPYYDYTLEIPENYVGRAMTDITAMSGTSSIVENDIENHIICLSGRAPVSTMNGYVQEVMAYTKGLGKLYLQVKGYDLCHNEEEVLQNTSYDPEADYHNTPSSVFCSHGAGEIIPWDEVSEHMHIMYGAAGNSQERDELAQAERLNSNRRKLDTMSLLDMSLSVEEVDSIIHSSTHANERGQVGAYKGKSAAMRLRNRNTSSPDASPKIYKGGKIKEKYLLVDGYNVIHTWKDLSELLSISLDAAAQKLNDILCNYQAITGINLMVVYDAYKVKGGANREKDYNNIRVVYTREAETADRYIERYAHENSSKYDITVVTSDGVEQVIVSGSGAYILSSREFEGQVKMIFSDFNEQFGVK